MSEQEETSIPQPEGEAAQEQVTDDAPTDENPPENEPQEEPATEQAQDQSNPTEVDQEEGTQEQEVSEQPQETNEQPQEASEQPQETTDALQDASEQPQPQAGEVDDPIMEETAAKEIEKEGDTVDQEAAATEVPSQEAVDESADPGQQQVEGDAVPSEEVKETALEETHQTAIPDKDTKTEEELKKVVTPVQQDTETTAPTSTPVVENVQTETVPTHEEEVDPKADTPRTSANLEATATVKFVLMPSGQVVTQACSLGQSLRELREYFAAELKMAPNLILLMFDGHTVEDDHTLSDLGVGPNGTIQLEMQSSDPVNTPIKTYRPRQEYHMPDVITVRVQAEDGSYTDIVVEIERTTRKKPYLGGYRHKKTSVEYHHASAQTMQKQRVLSNVPRFCRDTQTVEQRHRVQQTTNETSTQMTQIGIYVSNLPDKLIPPGRYVTADEHHAMLLSKIVIIQKYFRRWSAQKYVAHLKREKHKRLEWERQEEIRKKKEKEDRIKHEFERRMNPKSKEDFDLLFSALEKWRNEEMDRINAKLEGAERKAALCMLLEQETQLISAIGRHKLEADEENKEKRVQTFLKNAAAPKKWKGFDGKYTEMDTPYTIRAKELQDIFNSINMKYLTQDERLDVLLTLKHTVKEHDCKLTQEIIELIDREADLLMRGVRETNLDGLRKRISTLFLQYIKTPTFNPEAAKLLKVPQDPSTLRKNIYFCPSCSSYLPSTEFSLSSNSRHVGKCRRCAKVDNDARTRQDFSQYKFMLKNLRRSEDDYGDDSKIAFLMQEHDLRYLVENIWNGQSILSAWDDLFDLTVVRWDKHEEWSPWNCILLTRDEADAHGKISNLENGYGHVFVQKVQQKHTLARNYFSRLPGMAELIRVRANEKESRSGPSIMGQALPVQQRV